MTQTYLTQDDAGVDPDHSGSRVMVDELDIVSLVDVCKLIDKRGVPIGLSPAARQRISRAHQTARELASAGDAAYGLTTGVGSLFERPIGSNEQLEYQRRLLRSHAVGVGPPLPRRTVGLMLLLRVRSISRGMSGTAPETVDCLLDLLSAGLLPIVPSRGSVGASGDLAPLAHAMLPLIGEGSVTRSADGGQGAVPGAQALAEVGRSRITLGPREALSLVNGTALSTALAIEGWEGVTDLLNASTLVTAFAFVGLNGRSGALDERIAAAQGLPGTGQIAARLRALLRVPTRPPKASRSTGQDPYCLRCSPQILGAIRSELDEVQTLLAAAVDSVSDNPILDVQAREFLSGGNFHGLMMGRICDRLASAVANLATLTERQIAFAVDGTRTGLPDFLVNDGGMNSGLMMAHVTASALASECKVLATPASVDSISTSNGQEDVVPMSPLAGIRLSQAMDRLWELLSIGLIVQTQAVALRDDRSLPPGLRDPYQRVRQRIPIIEVDRSLTVDVVTGQELLMEAVRSLRVEATSGEQDVF